MRDPAALLFPFAFLCSAPLAAQAPQKTDAIAETVTEARVREVVGWLAADERQGRDTPSPGLEASAEWLGERFAAAGLRQVAQGSWFHEYTLPGLVFDSESISLVLSRRVQGQDDPDKFVLKPGDDVRLWRASDVVAGTEEPTTVAQADDPALRRLLMARAGRRPIVLEVPESHPYWLEAEGARHVLGRVRAASRPVFLVRDGILPPASVPEATWASDWAAPAPERRELPLKNVVALLPGRELTEEYVVVSAHYDHIGVGVPQDGDSICNGADDDASGTTAVVLIAEALARMPERPRRSILFVCFSAEEKGLLGSKAFVERPPVPREQIVADINLEMIGRPMEGHRKAAWVTGREYSDFASVAGKALARRGIEQIEFPMARMLFAASDNYSFVRHGIVAHSISAGSLHADYHRPSDEVEKLDIAHMTQVIRGLCEVVREFADRDQPPAWNEAGKKQLERAKASKRSKKGGR